MNNAIVAQSGGPTAAINASLTGVIEGVRKSGKYDRIYGAVNGIKGVLGDRLIDLTDLSEAEIELIYRTPACFLGSCRYKLGKPEEDVETYKNIFTYFEKKEIAAFFYIGGNDSMDTVTKLSKYGNSVGSSIRFAGVPKTIDNDLVCTDHTPGYGSAAKYIATVLKEVAYDTAIYENPSVTIVEIMGRNAGWLTAAAALARNEYNDIPQYIYLPEVAFSKEGFIADIKKALERTTNVVIAVSEGIHDADGNYIAASDAKEDKFGHAQLSGAGKTLEGIVRAELGIKCRSVEINILQRCAGHLQSKTDLDESKALGLKAVQLTEEGRTGFMTTLVRKSALDEQYVCEIGAEDLTGIANVEKKVPREWINEAGNDVTEELVNYIRPLIRGEVEVSYKDGLPVYAEIEHLVKGIK